MPSTVVRAVLLASLSVLALPSEAQQVLTGDLGACPDATSDGAALFSSVAVPAPRIEELGEVRVAGFAVGTQEHSSNFLQAIEIATRRLVSFVNDIPQASNLDFESIAGPSLSAHDSLLLLSLCFARPGERGFTFMPGVGVTNLDALPEAVTAAILRPSRYAVFPYEGPIEGLGDFRWSLQESYWPTSDLTRADAPNIEVMSLGAADSSVVAAEVWVPIQ